MSKIQLSSLMLSAVLRRMINSQCWAPFHLEYSYPVFNVSMLYTLPAICHLLPPQAFYLHSEVLSSIRYLSLISQEFLLGYPGISVHRHKASSSTPLRDSISLFILQTSLRVLCTSHSDKYLRGEVWFKEGNIYFGSYF